MTRRSRRPFTTVAVDLFCGAGGLSLGLIEGGIPIAAGIDLDPLCDFPFTHNIRAPFIRRDVSKLKPSDLASLFGNVDIRVLAACAPCQPFSAYTTKRGSSDDRWKLLLDVARLAKSVRPEIVTIENVSRLAKRPLWARFLAELSSVGYNIDWQIVDSSHYDVPQRRHRLVLLASLLGPISVPPGHMASLRTVQNAIGHLPAIGPGQRNDADPIHAARALTKPNLMRIRLSKPAGTWREWPDDLRTDCHRRVSGRTYPSVYGRMSWDKPSPTITTQFYGFGNGRFGHPDQDRAITLREGALLQSFPPSFKFFAHGERVNFRAIGRLIGNAVPPKLAAAIGKQILDHAAAAGGSGSRKPPASR